MAKSPTVFFDGGAAAYQCHNIGTVQKIATLSGTSQQISNAVSDNTSAVMLHTTVDCYIKIGSNPTAVAANDFLLEAGAYVVVAVRPGKDKVAAIGTSGTLTVTENNFFEVVT